MLCSACQKCVRSVFIVFATVFLFVVTKSLALQLIGDATAKGAPVLCTGRHPDVQKICWKVEVGKCAECDSILSSTRS